MGDYVQKGQSSLFLIDDTQGDRFPKTGDLFKTIIGSLFFDWSGD